MSESLLTVIDGPIARITFNRPEVRNAVNQEMINKMRDFLQRIENDTAVRAVVISGAGEHFMSGGDVSGFQDALSKTNEERRRDFEARVQNAGGLFAVLGRLRQPVVASVRGAVAGAALGFVTGADFALCADNSIFILSHVRIGASPDGASSFYLPRAVGVRKAKELALLGGKMEAQEALACGVVNWVVPDAEVVPRTEALLRKLVDAPRLSVQWAKKLMDVSLHNTLERQLQLEAEGFAAAAGTDDFSEGVRAFMCKRPPKFNQGG